MDKISENSTGVGRRAAPAKLGLGIAVAYTAPTVIHLDRTANAQVRPSRNTKGKGKGNPGATVANADI
jgi:hypothetical protein